MTCFRSTAFAAFLLTLSAQAADKPANRQVAVAPAVTKWIHMQTANFRVYSSAKERETRDLLNRLEHVHSFFAQMVNITAKNGEPADVVIFGSEKEYVPYRPKEFAIAYYQGTTDRDYIVIGKTGEDAAQTAAHEYTHLAFRRAGYDLPPWLNEGLAELYSNITQVGKNTEFGNALLPRVQALQSDKWVPLQAILAADEQSPYYNETKQAGSLYNEGWALVHMLTTTPEYRAKFSAFLELVAKGAPSAAALEKVYGQPLDKLETALRTYIQNGYFNKLSVPIQTEDIDKIQAQPADLYNVRLLEADLLVPDSDTKKQDAARKTYTDLITQNAARPEAWSGLAYLDLRTNRREAGLANLSKAMSLGDHSPKLLRDYIRLTQQSRPEDALKALKELTKLEPDNANPRVDLATMQLTLRQYQDALDTAKSITNVTTAEQRDRLLYIRAASALQVGDEKEARDRASELQRLTTNVDYNKRATDLLRVLSERDKPEKVEEIRQVDIDKRLDERDAAEAARIEKAIKEESDKRPEEFESLLPETDPADIPHTVKGKLVELNCKAPAIMILDTDEGRKNFVILTPDRLIVKGHGEGPAELKCGPQKPPQPVELRVLDPPYGIDAAGVVRGVTFLSN